MPVRTPSRAVALAALATVAAASLAACGSSEGAGNAASTAASNAATAASNAASAASVAASAASSAASNAATAAGDAASSVAASASSAASTAAAAASSNASDAAASAGAYTLADVKKHATPTDCWAAIKAPGETSTGVYDLTKWINQHPGGPARIEALCGTDATAAFAAQHGEDGANGRPEQALAGFKIGTLKG